MSADFLRLPGDRSKTNNARSFSAFRRSRFRLHLRRKAVRGKLRPARLVSNAVDPARRAESNGQNLPRSRAGDDMVWAPSAAWDSTETGRVEAAIRKIVRQCGLKEVEDVQEAGMDRPGRGRGRCGLPVGFGRHPRHTLIRPAGEPVRATRADAESSGARGLVD
jgi:hypothetical protein